MKVKSVRLFVDLLLVVMIPVVLFIMSVDTWMDVRDLELKLTEDRQLATEGLGEYEWETAVVHYILDVEYEMNVNQELNTLAMSYIFLGAMEGIVLVYVFKNFKNGKYIEVE